MLVDYLNKNFVTIERLEKLTNINSDTIRFYQRENMMPLASYTLELTTNCHSFTGGHNEKCSLEYYAKGYISWLSLVHVLKGEESVFKEFSYRYNNTLSSLKGLECGELLATDSGVILADWKHFLQGTYGLCTSTGLPEQIATKAFATGEIKRLVEREILHAYEKEQLKYFVDLLDKSCSFFAPHERLTSSRRLLIEDVRRKYSLEG